MSDLTGEQAFSLIHRANTLSTLSSLPLTLQNKTLANLFFENSTRTRISFEMAAKQLGANVINFEANKSSMAKGETIYDTLKTLESMGVEGAVIRHSDDHLLEELRSQINMSLVNAGAGKNEHPSQALLDNLTIYQEFGKIEGLTIAICGDTKYSRVANSNIKLLNMLGAKVLVSGPDDLLPEQNKLPPNTTVCSFDEAIAKADVVMLLRIQLERHDGIEINSKDYNQRFGLNATNINQLKPKAIIMHPGPFNRGVEIADELVECKQSRIFKQVQNGVLMRMAILEQLLTK